MIEQALKYVADLANGGLAVNFHKLGERQYTDKTLIEQREPLPAIVNVRTLSGFSDLVTARVEGFDPQDFIAWNLSAP